MWLLYDWKTLVQCVSPFIQSSWLSCSPILWFLRHNGLHSLRPVESRTGSLPFYLESLRPSNLSLYVSCSCKDNLILFYFLFSLYQFSILLYRRRVPRLSVTPHDKRVLVSKLSLLSVRRWLPRVSLYVVFLSHTFVGFTGHGLLSTLLSCRRVVPYYVGVTTPTYKWVNFIQVLYNSRLSFALCHPCYIRTRSIHFTSTSIIINGIS